MTDIDTHFRGIGISLLQRIVGLNATALITDACQPRAGRATLDIALRESSRKRESTMVEGVVGSHIGNLHRDVTRLQSRHIIVTVDITGQRFRSLVTEVETDTAAVVVEIELVVLVHPFPFRWIDRYADTYPPVDGGQ